MAKSGFWRTLVLVLGLSLVATVPAHAQNGLQRFEKEIKPQLEFKSFTYAKAAALGDKGFTLSSVVVVVPGSATTGGKDNTIKIEKVTVEEADFDRMKDGGKSDDIPLFAKLKIEGMTGDDTMSTALAPYGVPKVPVDVTLDYRLDTATKVLTLSKLEVSLRGEARVALALVVDGISDKSSQMQGSKDDGRLRTASLDIDDTGLLAKVLPALAQAQGTTPEAMVAMATVPLAGFTAGQGPATLKALDSLVSFIGDWKQPKGPIKIAIKPAKSASVADLDKVMEPNALTDIFGLTVDYAGTRPGAASGASAGAATSPQAAATAPAAAGDAKTMTGGEAWLSIVGNTLTGKIDGDIFFEFYRKDGTLTLMEGSDLTKGKWTIEGEKVCFKYPDEDKDCFTVSRTGEVVTLGGGKGKGLRLTLLPGNPKDL